MFKSPKPTHVNIANQNQQECPNREQQKLKTKMRHRSTGEAERSKARPEAAREHTAGNKPEANEREEPENKKHQAARIPQK